MVKKIMCSVAVLFIFSGALSAQPGKETDTFQLREPDFERSPYTGMTREHWIEAGRYILDGAFSYIQGPDDPMKFPKQFDKTYPHNEGQVPTEKLEGLCRTLFVAAPLLREDPELTLNGIKVADYYHRQILNLLDSQHPSFIKHRGNGGPSQILVEFGALAISLSVAADVIWDSFTPEQKDALAATMLSYGDGPTIGSNWRFFNIFILSFFKDQGYPVNEELLLKYVKECQAAYRGCGWYNDSPAYDYYSMWAFQLYGPLWAELYGKKYWPEEARPFLDNLRDAADNYPYMFSRDGKMNMWGRSISYRFGAVAPFPMMGFFNDPSLNYGWFRRISSATLLQFIEHPGFLEDRVPTLGFYGPFAPAVQIYSCRGSVYWFGKAFFALLLPADNPFWSEKENNGPWERELKPGQVFNTFQPGSNLLITNYPNSGASEMRSWCHESVAKDWQQFRSGENYNKLAYNTEFPWMADGPNGEISMNFGVLNAKNQWEVLRLYTFREFTDGVYYREAVLETDENIKFQLRDIPLPDGILRVDKVTVPRATDIRLGHYALPELERPISTSIGKSRGNQVYTVTNGEHRLAMIPLYGWEKASFVNAQGLHPVSQSCMTINTHDSPETERIYVTLQLWKKGDRKFTVNELNPVRKIAVSEAMQSVKITFHDHSEKTIYFE